MNKIRELREAMSLCQIDVTNATGIDQKTLSNYEMGKTNPDSYALIKLADFFDVSIDYLVDRPFSKRNENSEILRKIDVIAKELYEIKQLLK
ncbi:MAG: helix-turn-helix transcriptional regulator [Clostridia bacterium]|nr:helix-turn-helix transcriptional regulator [Clostridia bacterium]